MLAICFVTRSLSGTIFGLASGNVRCALSVLRVSGALSKKILSEITCAGNQVKVFKPRRATYSSFYHPITKELLDKGIVIWFPGPASFTGEDSCEFHVHGSLAVIDAMQSALSCIPGVRLAERGEFTRRAFENGKLNVVQAEALADLIESKTSAQRRSALRQMEGSFHKFCKILRSRLIKSAANIEALIDFGEEAGIEELLILEINEEINHIIELIKQVLVSSAKRERIHSGVHAVIVGETNAGKSSLLNLLCGKPAAIVSPTPGTTRDVIEARLDMDGYLLTLGDCAGLRRTTNPVELEGVNRALNRAKSADILILVIDAVSIRSTSVEDIQNFLKQHLVDLSLASSITKDAKLLVVVNKIDKAMPNFVPNVDNADLSISLKTPSSSPPAESNIPVNVSFISVKTTAGVHEFTDVLRSALKDLCGNPQEDEGSCSLRHRTHLLGCQKCLENFLTERHLDIAADYLRSAVKHIDKITGESSHEEVLDMIFSRFCIGK